MRSSCAGVCVRPCVLPPQDSGIRTAPRFVELHLAPLRAIALYAGSKKYAYAVRTLASLMSDYGVSSLDLVTDGRVSIVFEYLDRSRHRHR